jgi:phosphoglycerate dehydrogenase-like enzyme
MTLTVLEPEGLYPTTELEQRIMGPGVRILQGACKASLAELPDELCQQAEGLMTLRMAVPADQIARFPKLKVVIRMGVGYDRVDRAACARLG